MNNLEALTREQVAPANQEIFDQLKGKIGMIPNLYATAANSPVALGAILQYGEALGAGSLSQKEIEAVALAVSQTNSCNYCLAAHTAIGKMAGFSEDQTVNIRKGDSSGDSKLDALVNLARFTSETRGLPNQDTVDAFFAAGYSKAALVEVIGLVAVNTFNNYLNNIADTKIDFPAAPAI